MAAGRGLCAFAWLPCCPCSPPSCAQAPPATRPRLPPRSRPQPLREAPYRHCCLTRLALHEEPWPGPGQPGLRVEVRQDHGGLSSGDFEIGTMSAALQAHDLGCATPQALRRGAALQVASGRSATGYLPCARAAWVPGARSNDARRRGEHQIRTWGRPAVRRPPTWITTPTPWGRRRVPRRAPARRLRWPAGHGLSRLDQAHRARSGGPSPTSTRRSRPSPAGASRPTQRVRAACSARRGARRLAAVAVVRRVRRAGTPRTPCRYARTPCRYAVPVRRAGHQARKLEVLVSRAGHQVPPGASS